MSRFGVEKVPFDYLEELAQKHKILRKEAGYSQSELALRSGVSLGSIKRFEATGQISLDSLLRTCHVLNRLEDFDMLLNSKSNLKAIEKLFSDKTRI
jgi:transcriptional regulator with XRE-family HTH domain